MRQQGMVGGNHLKEGRERVVILQIFRGLEASLALSGRRERQRERVKGRGSTTATTYQRNARQMPDA